MSAERTSIHHHTKKEKKKSNIQAIRTLRNILSIKFKVAGWTPLRSLCTTDFMTFPKTNTFPSYH